MKLGPLEKEVDDDEMGDEDGLLLGLLQKAEEEKLGGGAGVEGKEAEEEEDELLLKLLGKYDPIPIPTSIAITNSPLGLCIPYACCCC